ncbi:MAG: phosphate ABC transporter substrate-binding protein [Gammaproteobacteria bacterium]
MWNRLRIIFVMVAMLTAWAAQAGSLTIIANPSVNLTAAEVRDVFIGEKQFAGSVKLTPVDNSAAQVAFLQQVIQLDASRYSAVWAKKSFRDGVIPPSVKNSDAEVIGFVKSTPGAIGYVTSPADGVKVIK